MKTLKRASLNYFLTSIFLLVLIAFISPLSNCAHAQLRISNLTLESGSDRREGAVYRARLVYANIDALIRIDSLVNGASIIDVDQTNVGFDDAFQPRIQSGGNGTSYAVFTFRFVRANTNIAEVLGSVTVANIDLDGNNNLKEFSEFDMGGGRATFMSNTPEIMVRNNNGRFYGENISGREYSGIDTAADAVMYKVSRNMVTQFSVRLGAIVSNGAVAARQYSVYMRDFDISNPISLPLTLLNFSAIVKDNNKVNLNWTTTDHKEFSHFVLQRSTDGKNYKDVMTLFTEPVATSAVNQYSYADNITGIGSGVVYYRLQMVDVDTKYQYSPIRMVRLNTNNMVQIQTFPNPVTSELRVTIPSNWQEKTTTYEIYSSNGMLVSRTQIARAAQVQQLNVQSLGSGNYIIRVTNGQEMSSSKFVKY